MPTFEVDYNYLVREFGTDIVEAIDIDDAEERVVDLVNNSNPDLQIEEVEIETVKEIIR